MYALPLHDASFDLVLLQMVLHYAEDAAAAMAEARRVLAPSGQLVVVDVAPHDRAELRARMAHHVLGFSDDDMTGLLAGAGLRAEAAVSVPGPLTVRIWRAKAAHLATHLPTHLPTHLAVSHADHFEGAL
jgi:ArsR family transcriptional regulator